MIYTVVMGTLPIRACEIEFLKNALSRHADFTFVEEPCNGTDVTLHAYCDWDLGDAEHGHELTYEQSWDLCRRLYRIARKASSIPPCSVIAIYPANGNEDDGWLHAFTPV